MRETGREANSSTLSTTKSPFSSPSGKGFETRHNMPSVTAMAAFGASLATREMESAGSKRASWSTSTGG